MIKNFNYLRGAFMLKNYMEDIVDEVLPGVLKEYKNICKCEKCLEDIKAITLNELKPKYVVTNEGVVYTKLKELNCQSRTDVLTKLIMAIEKVSKSPRHA